MYERLVTTTVRERPNPDGEEKDGGRRIIRHVPTRASKRW